MKHIINHKILTLENSNLSIDDYSNKYAYMYILRSKYKLDLENSKENFQITCDFKIKNYYYLIFWALKEVNNFTLITDNIKDLKITNYLFKTEDSYVLRRKNVFFTHIDQILDQQYVDLVYQVYKRKQILSTPLFNILTSNKILYHKYFISKGLMLNTKIENLSTNEINNYNKSYIIKAPYSSSSSCVKLGNFISRNCYVNDGVIVSKMNYTTKSYELKIHTFEGNIVYCLVKNIEDKVIILDSELNLRENDNSEYTNNIMKNVMKYKKEIYPFVKEVYKNMNELLYIINFKLDYEMVKYIIPLKLNKSIFYNINEYTKLKILEYLLDIEDKPVNNDKILEYIDFLKLKPDEIKNKFKINIDKSKYSEKYMRIDIMLPDYLDYNEISLLEIEPYACGKGHVRYIRSSIDIIQDKYIPESSQSLVFTKFFQLNIMNNFDFNWEDIKN